MHFLVEKSSSCIIYKAFPSENWCFMITLEALKYWLDMLLGSFHDLTCTVSHQQDAAHHLPMNFSAVESFSRLMVSKRLDSSISQLSQTEAACSQLPKPFLFWFWERGWGWGKGSLLQTWVSNPHLHPTKLNTEGHSFAFLCGFLGCIFQAVCLWQHLKKNVWVLEFGCVVLLIKRCGVSLLFLSLNYGSWMGLLLPLTWVLPASPCWAKSMGSVFTMRSPPFKLTVAGRSNSWCAPCVCWTQVL